MRCTSSVFLAAFCLFFIRDARSQSTPPTGNCDPATAEAYLDINNVRARIFNGGNLFWRGGPSVYEVPKGGGVSAVFSQTLAVGGLVDGELRTSAARYGNYEFWPGPLDDAGTPPDDCTIYDHIYTITRADVAAYERGDPPAPDLVAWPTGLGAPTFDAAGQPIDLMDEPLTERATRVIDLEAGERPEFTGDQMAWWIMNDAGNAHGETETPPIGLEVHATAFAFDMAGPARDATFYRYRMFYRGPGRFDSVYVGANHDVDLGSFDDDYVGSDTARGLAFAYNADNFDESSFGYGDRPPAVGLDFVRGPLVDTTRLGMTAFLFYYGGGGIEGDPQSGSDYYNYMRALWKDGSHLTREGRFGMDPQAPPTNFMFDGDPVTHSFWSEFNVDGSGTANYPADRRYLMASGPFTIVHGAAQDVILAVLWARGASNIDSITELRKASDAMQAFFDSDFATAPPVSPPTVNATSYDNAIALTWTSAESGGLTDDYAGYAPALGGTYRFEGYNVYRYATTNDTVGTRVATYDIVNEVTEIIEGKPGQEQLNVAWGTDAGVRHYHIVAGLTNYETYCFGVEAYAYKEGYYPTVIRSPVSRICAEPRQTGVLAGEPPLGGAVDTLHATAEVGHAAAGIVATIVDPARITGSRYRLRFIESACAVDDNPGSPCVSYELSRNDGTVLVTADPTAPGRFGDGLFQFDGLEWSIRPFAPAVRYFLTTANADGPLDPPDIGTLSLNDNGFPVWPAAPDPTHGIPTRGFQQATNESVWGIHHGGGNDNKFSTFVARVLRIDNSMRLGGFDYEWRFTESGGLAYREFEDDIVVSVPFELWRTGHNTPGEPGDDLRLVPVICESVCRGESADYVFDIGGDSGVSDGSDDPESDWVYWYLPQDQTPGQAGYDAVFAEAPVGTDLRTTPGYDLVEDEVFARTVLVQLDGGVGAPYIADLPEVGTVFRIVTEKPYLPGDIYVIDTAPVVPTARTRDESVAALETIGIVPNPYYGFSEYEVSMAEREVRFTNVPPGAEVNIFTLSGSRVRSLSLPSSGVLRWDLRNEAGKLVANGIYLIHVDVPDVGSRVLKFSLVRSGGDR